MGSIIKCGVKASFTHDEDGIYLKYIPLLLVLLHSLNIWRLFLLSAVSAALQAAALVSVGRHGSTDALNHAQTSYEIVPG